MPKPVTVTIKLQVPGGQANPAPPVGPALGQHGVNIGEFVRRFNDETKNTMGELFNVIIRVFADRTFDMHIKSKVTSFLIKRAAGLAKGSQAPGTESAGTLSKEQVRQLAEEKMSDLGAHSVEAAMRVIEGSARSMGIQVERAGGGA